MAESADAYSRIIEAVFHAHFEDGLTEFEFERDEIISAADQLLLDRPANVGDVIYAFRHRRLLPTSIRQTASDDREWVIEGRGRARYVFRLTTISRIAPRDDLVTVKVPDATPEIISRYALGDEQALLAKVRYNRLVDTFLGITTYSLQNHLRTTVAGIGQIEIDELYVGLNRDGVHFVVPVQAKGGSDQLGIVQTTQDLACCREKFPTLVCRPVSAQFMSDNVIAMFELTVQDDAVRVVNERHYKLVASRDLSDGEVSAYRGTLATD